MQLVIQQSRRFAALSARTSLDTFVRACFYASKKDLARVTFFFRIQGGHGVPKTFLRRTMNNLSYSKNV